MVGLSVVLEGQKNCINKKTTAVLPQVINKTTMMMLGIHNHNKPTFLDQCFLCGKRLLPGKDIYMYKGDRAFCSVDCRCKQILTDEEEAIQKDMMPTSSSSSTPERWSLYLEHRSETGGL